MGTEEFVAIEMDEVLWVKGQPHLSIPRYLSDVSTELFEAWKRAHIYSLGATVCEQCFQFHQTFVGYRSVGGDSFDEIKPIPFCVV